MSEMLASIGNFFTSQSGEGLMKGGLLGGGVLQNILAERQRASKQKFVEDLLKDPVKFNAYVSKFVQPLNQGLTSEVARATDAYGAERGLGSSPTVMKDVYAQAMGPLMQQQQATAIQAALQSLGIFEQSPTMKPVDLGGIFKLLQMQPPKPTVPTPPTNTGGGTPDFSSLLSGGADSVPLPTPTVDYGMPAGGDF